MAYEATFALSLGVGNTGIADLRAQLIDNDGGDVGSAVSSGFVEIDNGFYQWTYASMPDDHRGGVRFYSNASSSVTLSFSAVNPEELEYTNIKTSELATTLSSISSAISALPAAVWAVATSGLSSAGTIGKLLVDNINATISSRSSHSVADVWDALTSGITTSGSIGRLIIQKLGLILSPISQTTSGGGDITITRAVTLNGLEIDVADVPANWERCYFTVKDDLRDDLDSQSIIQIVVTNGGDAGDGLLYLNAAAATAGQGSLSVGADSVTVTLADDASALLVDCQGLDFDVKFVNDDSTSYVGRSGTADVNLTATRTV